MRLRRRSVPRSDTLGQFLPFYFVLSWLPFYLVQERGYSIERMATLGGLTYVMHAIGAYATGRVTDHLIERGQTPHRVYKTTLVASQISSATCLLGVLLGGTVLSSASLLAVGFTFGLASPTLYAVAPAARRAKGGGAVGRLPGFRRQPRRHRRPCDHGLSRGSLGQFYSAFVLAIAISLVGVLSWTVIIRRIAPVEWGDVGNGFYPTPGTSSALAP